MIKISPPSLIPYTYLVLGAPLSFLPQGRLQRALGGTVVIAYDLTSSQHWEEREGCHSHISTGGQQMGARGAGIVGKPADHLLTNMGPSSFRDITLSRNEGARDPGQTHKMQDCPRRSGTCGHPITQVI
ncbi:Hypothetical predicted protein [Pelobates cultripes]|uniref:Uncharacterized protein n=1 Tax=Pelobates cultripes TaxID=61616 RepID=A0AAD1TCQ5_PELCU|nr:Hypothetical predicted protein [Pelobates cultripes]